MYKVILVDEEYTILSELEKIINWGQLGLECVAKLSDGQMALNYVENNPVDIVITDVGMSQMSGFEFIRQAQIQDINFNFIILSGYQNFNYVKEGINLGAENFLLKPVDTVELNNTIEKTVDRLDEEKRNQQSEDFLFDNTIVRWVNDELDPVNLRQIMTELDYPLESNGLYSTIIVEGITEERKSIWAQAMINLDQHYYYFTEDSMVAIIKGARLKYESVRTTIINHILNDNEIIALGETFVQLEAVHKSFNQAESMIGVANFYGKEEHIYQANLKKDMKNEKKHHEVSFEKFHHTLSIGDEKLIHNEINSLLNKTIELEADPEYVRYLSLLIFSDIYRQHENYDNDQHCKYFQKMNETESLKDIKKVLNEVLDANLAYAEFKQYSRNVQEILEIIYKKFNKKITITSIADELHLNAMYLGRIFKKETDYSFSQYLNQFRIEQSQNLLLHSNHNLNEIAELVGYASSGYFYTNFKKECGISPKEFRDRYIDQGNNLNL